MTWKDILLLACWVTNIITTMVLCVVAIATGFDKLLAIAFVLFCGCALLICILGSALKVYDVRDW